MHRVLFTGLGLMFLLFISGCDSSHSHLTDYSLCKKIATLPSYNIHKEAREKEVRSRGLSCRKFASRIDKESAEERLAQSRAPKSYNTYSNTYQNNSSSTSSNSDSPSFEPRKPICTRYQRRTYGC